MPSAICGVGLCIVAIGGITAIPGLPVFLRFIGITWVALIDHLLYGTDLVALPHLDRRA